MKKVSSNITHNDKYYISLFVIIVLYNVMAFLLLCGFIYAITITARDRPENIRIVRSTVAMTVAFSGISMFVGCSLKNTIQGLMEIRKYIKRRCNKCKKEI